MYTNTVYDRKHLQPSWFDKLATYTMYGLAICTYTCIVKMKMFALKFHQIKFEYCSLPVHTYVYA